VTPPPLPKRGSLQFRAWHTMTQLHVLVYRLTGGRVGGRMVGSQVLLLDHVGRRSGQRRTVPLLYLPDGDDLVIIASRGGSHQMPAWWLNLQADPETTVQVGSERRTVRAREAEGEERERLWTRAVEMYSDYAAYQTRTDRRIPVIVLSPTGA